MAAASTSPVIRAKGRASPCCCPRALNCQNLSPPMPVHSLLMSLELRESSREGVVILSLKGRLTGGEASAVREKVSAVAAAGSVNVDLNLEHVEYIDSTGLG